MKTRKREFVRELLFSKSFSGKVKHRVKKELRDRATDELRTICIFRDRLRNDLRKKTRFFCSSSLDAENAQNAPSFCISLVRSRDEIETKRKEACELRTMCIFRDRLRNDLSRRTENFAIIVSSSLDAENAQNAPSFCISLVRSRDEIETKRKEACELRTI